MAPANIIADTAMTVTTNVRTPACALHSKDGALCTRSQGLVHRAKSQSLAIMVLLLHAVALTADQHHRPTKTLIAGQLERKVGGLASIGHSAADGVLSATVCVLPDCYRVKESACKVRTRCAPSRRRPTSLAPRNKCVPTAPAGLALMQQAIDKTDHVPLLCGRGLVPLTLK